MTMEKPEIVFLGHCAKLSGAELALVRLLSALGDRIDAHVILGENGPLVDRLWDAGATVEVLPMAATARDVKRDSVRARSLRIGPAVSTSLYVVALARRLRELRPDIVHTNTLKAALYGGAAAKLARVPVVWHIRDRIAPDYLPQGAARVLREIAARLPDAVIGYDPVLQTLGSISGRKVRVDDPVDTRCFDVAASEPNGCTRVGIVGRIARWKGQDVFLDAYARAFGPQEEFQAVVVGAPLFGEEDFDAEVRARAADLGIGGRVDFRGFRDDVPAELERLHIVVHASTIPEPFGQVVVEAMAAARPVIAADAGGPALVITNEIDGLLTAPGDPNALAVALRRLADDRSLQRRIGTAGQRRAREFSPDEVAERVVRTYRWLLDFKTPTRKARRMALTKTGRTDTSTDGSADLRSQMEALPWFHTIDLGRGVQTAGLYNPAKKVKHLQLPTSLASRTVLDIGAWDGFYSFDAERRGAKRVVAADWFCWNGPGWGNKASFELARRALRSQVEDVDIDVMDLSPERIGTFDLVYFFGVLYHLRDPLAALERVSSVTANQLILETEVDLMGLEQPAAAFYPGRELASDDTNWWGPNPAAVVGMLQVAGFSRIEIVYKSSLPWRVVRATRRKVVGRDRGSLRTQIHRGRLVAHAWK